MSWRSVAALLFLAFAGGVLGFAWLSSGDSMFWAESGSSKSVVSADTEEELLAVPQAAAFAVPAIIQPSGSQAEATLLVQTARRALETGKPLGDLGSRLQVTFGNSQPAALATIARAARQPLSNAQLLAGLDLVADKLALPSGTAWDRMQYEFQTLFVLRSQNGTPNAAGKKIQTIREKIVGGDIATAARLVRAMPGSSYAAEWLAEAERAIALQAAFDSLSQATLSISTPQLLAPKPDEATPNNVGDAEPIMTDQPKPE